MNAKWLVIPLVVVLDPATQFPGERQVQTPTLEDVRIMTGCWEGTFRDRSGRGVIEEHYSAPTENLVVGTTRYIRNGRTVQFEFTMIQADSNGVRLTPYPGGRRSEHDFVLTRWALDLLVFEAPEHDYPKRIIYRKDASGGLRARIDSGPSDRAGREWYLQKAECF